MKDVWVHNHVESMIDHCASWSYHDLARILPDSSRFRDPVLDSLNWAGTPLFPRRDDLLELWERELLDTLMRNLFDGELRATYERQGIFSSASPFIGWDYAQIQPLR